jgi:GMP reductase
MVKKYSYNDIVLEPNYSEIESRDNVNTYVHLCGRDFRCAAIPSNMICTIDFDKAVELSENGYFYVLHRFYDYDKIYKWIDKHQMLRTISISVGVKEKDKELIDRISHENLRVDFITIDVAHGHSIMVKKMIRHIRINLNQNIKIIGGNIGTPEAAIDLANWGCDAVKVGLSMGKSCTTYNCTGVGTPMFSTVRDIVNVSKVPVIADGQVREVGDVCKALVAGATMVMIGSEFAKCMDSPAEVVTVTKPNSHKYFFGSASEYTKGNTSHIEGTRVLLETKGKTYIEYMNEINDGISSCCSYAGVDTIPKLITMKHSLKN